ncbi:hypothetical protein ACLKA6_006312 [Drosophila palustris]
MTTLETSKPQFTFTQFGATEKRIGRLERIEEDWRDRAMAESWRGGGTLIFNFSTTSLWALGRAHTRVSPPKTRLVLQSVEKMWRGGDGVEDGLPGTVVLPICAAR